MWFLLPFAMVRIGLALVGFLLLIGTIGCDCPPPTTYVYQDDPFAALYTSFGAGSWWEFVDKAGNQKRFTVAVFHHTLYDVTQQCQHCHCKGSRQFAYTNVLTATDSAGSLFHFSRSSEDTWDEEFTLHLDTPYGAYSFNCDFRQHNPIDTANNDLVDTALIMNVAGIRIDSIRHYRLFTKPVQTHFYLAPHIGPVFLLLSDGQEWTLVNYHTLPPPE